MALCRDLWVIGSDATFGGRLKPGAVGDRMNAPWAVIARSTWHGPNQDGK